MECLVLCGPGESIHVVAFTHEAGGGSRGDVTFHDSRQSSGLLPKVSDSKKFKSRQQTIHPSPYYFVSKLNAPYLAGDVHSFLAQKHRWQPVKKGVLGAKLRSASFIC